MHYYTCMYFFLSNNDETNMDNWTFYSFSTFIIPIDDIIKWFEWFISGYFDILLFDWWYSHYHTYYHFVVILCILNNAVGTMLIISQENLLWMDHSIQWLSGYSNTILGSWIPEGRYAPKRGILESQIHQNTEKMILSR